MLSYFYSSSPEPKIKEEESTDPSIYPELGPEFDEEVCFSQLIQAFENRDGKDWQLHLDEPNFKQWWCYVENCPVIWLKCRTVLKCPAELLRVVGQDLSIRETWDLQCKDFKKFFKTPDGSKCRFTFTFKSPAPLMVSDREFYIQELTRKDWPQPGDIAMIAKSLPEHKELPIDGSKVRANMVISGFIYRPKIDE